MPGIRVVTDSACDLPVAVIERHNIGVVPLTIRFGDEELVAGPELSPKEFWSRVAASPLLPSTAAPSPGAFEAAYRHAADAGADGVVCVTLSSSLSATYQSAVVAAEAVASQLPVRVVDSRSVTIGQGLMAVAAAEAAQNGADIDGVVEAAEDLIARTRVFAALDTLENLKKGGRIGAAAAMFGSLLSIKPIIEVTDGAVEPESKQRTRSRSLRYLVDKLRQFPNATDLAVMHGEAPDIEVFLDMIGEVVPRSEITVGDVGAVIGTHAGPRVIGIAFHTA